MSQPLFVWPLHDPAGNVLPHMGRVATILETVAAGALVGVTSETRARQPGLLAAMRAADFFSIVEYPAGLSLGRRLYYLYAEAARRAESGQCLHLSFPDRVAFAVLTEHRGRFIADVGSEHRGPRLFVRSSGAWETHPRNYRQLEQFLTQVGLLLFGRELDFAWCHLALSARKLDEVLAVVAADDFSLLAKMTLYLRREVELVPVDWLAWEDPFLFGRDPASLRMERERSAAETRKRLVYVLPMLDALYRWDGDAPQASCQRPIAPRA